MTRGAASFAAAVLFLTAAPLSARKGQSNAAQADTATLLKAGASIERTLDGSERHAYDIELQAGQYAALTVDQHGIDVVIRVLDASGKPVATFDEEARKDGREHVAFVADVSRAYRVTVSARYPKQEAARYAIWIDEVRAATDPDRALYEARRLSLESADLRTAGKLDEGLAKASRALSLAEEVSGPQGAYVGLLASALGGLQRAKGQQHEAEQSFLRAIDVSQAALGRESPQTALMLENLGDLYMQTEDYAKAEPLLSEAMMITERALGDHPRLVSCLMDESVLHAKRGDSARALTELQRAHQLADRTMSPDDFISIAIVNNLGNLYVDLGDYDRAQPFVEQAVRDLERTVGPDNYRVTTPLSNLSIIARDRGDYTRALEYLKRVYDIRVKTYGTEHTQTASTLITIGNVYHAQGDYQAALDAYQRAYDVLERTAGPYHSFTMMAINNAVNVYANSGKIDAALEYQKKYDAYVEKTIAFNLAIGSEREKVAYLQSTFQKMGRTISLHLRQAPASAQAADQAALAILRRKGRVLDTVADSRAALRTRLDPGDRTLLDELAAVTTQLAQLAIRGPARQASAEYKKTLAALQERQESLESQMSSRSAEFRAGTQAVTLSALRSTLPQGSALVEFTVYRPFDFKGKGDKDTYGEPRYAAYVIRRDGPTRGVDLGSAAAIDDAAERTRGALRNPARRDVMKLARALDELVLRPVRPLIGDATQLLVAPDGPLNLIPFEALVDEKQRFQVERYAISYLGSGRDLLRMQVPRPSVGAPLVIADPAFGEPTSGSGSGATSRAASTTAPPPTVYFAPLAGTRQEAATIGRLLPNATVLTGARASKAALTQAAAPSILHIASHAFFIPAARAAQATELAGTRSMSATVESANPLLRSGIALAGANVSRRDGDPGILTALEASTLNLWGTRLVTLSACDTGVGDVKNGDGVYGLRRAFFIAGAETLVMSLWPVSDYTTRTLMTRYYEGLARGQGRGAALRRVQLAMLTDKARRHPFYWAGFIQAGDWTPIPKIR